MVGTHTHLFHHKTGNNSHSESIHCQFSCQTQKVKGEKIIPEAIITKTTKTKQQHISL